MKRSSKIFIWLYREKVVVRTFKYKIFEAVLEQQFGVQYELPVVTLQLRFSEDTTFIVVIRVVPRIYLAPIIYYRREVFYNAQEIIISFKLWINIISVNTFLALGVASAITFKEIYICKGIQDKDFFIILYHFLDF